MTVVRRLPAVVIVAVLALLPLQAWLQASRPDVRYSRPIDGLDGITWAATVSPDGQLAVTIVYDLSDQTRESSIRLPSGSRFARADGVAISTDSGRYGEVQSDGPLTVTYQRVGAVTRYDDGVIVDFAGLGNSDQHLFPCATCYLGVDGYGNTSLAGAVFADELTDARMAISGVEQLRSGEDDGALRFVGVVPAADGARMIVWLPVDAAPDASRVSGVPGAAVGETAAQVWEATLAADGASWHEGDPGPPIGKIAAALALTAMWVLLVAWIAWRLVAAQRALDADRPDTPIMRDATFSPPSAIEPAVVAALVGDAGPGRRSAVAATLLSLAHRGVIRIDGTTSERYTLTMPTGAVGATEIEETVLAELRPQGQTTSTATLTGPPLWAEANGKTMSRRAAGLAGTEARRARFVRVTLTAWVLIPASLAMGIVALIATGGTSALAWVVTIVGPVVALGAVIATGTSLTAKGRAEQAQWLEYGAWLRENSQLGGVGAPGIAVWGEPLIYATVLGAAPEAAAALGVS